MTALTLTDLFCGAGGSSTGADKIAGVEVRMAANHWALAVETHNKNHPNADHDCADISQVDPRRYPTTDILWASPECTNHSRAKGIKRNLQQPDLFGETVADEAAERSRATMWDVVRFTEVHNYRAVIVENVVEVTKWNRAGLQDGALFDAWVAAMRGMGYEHRVVSLNSMHASRLGAPAPQSRDRVYIVFWRAGERAPDFDKWIRPPALCSSCNEIVEAIPAFKDPTKVAGRFGRRQQYVYRCPKTTCRNEIVDPGWLPASAAIDWTLPGTRIGDRDKPLADKTRARIKAGIERHWQPVHLEAAGNQYDSCDPKHPSHGKPGAYVRAWPATDPMKTVHTIESKALAIPPLMIPVEGRDGKGAGSAAEPMRTQTARAETAVGFPPLVAELRGGGSTARPASDPLATVTAGGNHHALVTSYYGNGATRSSEEPLGTQTTHDRHALLMRNNEGGAEMSTPVDEAARTMTTAGHQSLLVPAGGTWNDDAKPTDQPHRAITTREAYALMVSGQSGSGNGSYLSKSVAEAARTVTANGSQFLAQPDETPPSLDVDDVLFRMLQPHEVIAAMAFPSDYEVLGNKRERIKMAGNAVTPPAARDLVAAVAEAITGDSIEPLSWQVAA